MKNSSKNVITECSWLNFYIRKKREVAKVLCYSYIKRNKSVGFFPCNMHIGNNLSQS